jgi:hypothetical protein
MVLTVAICVTLLQLPVPIRHDHGQFVSAENLTRHVCRHHDGDCDLVPDGQHAHWHFLLPAELRYQADPEPDHAAIDVDFVASIPATSIASGSLDRWLACGCTVDDLAADAWWLAWRTPQSHSWQPLNSMLCVGGRGASLAVMRC